MEPSSQSSNSDPGLRAFVSKLISSVVIAAVVAALDVEFKGSWAPWLHRAVPWVFAALVIYLVAATVRLVAPRLRRKAHERRADTQIREQVAALAEAFTESMSQSFVKSAGSILNPLHSASALDARLVNVYGCYLGTLCLAGRHLVTDLRSKRLSAVAALSRLSDLHRDYARVCFDLASAVSTTSRRDLHIAWDEIRDNTNSISDRLSNLSRHVRELQGGEGPSPYFQNVPRSLHP